MNLRDYQLQAIDDVRAAYRQGHQGVFLRSPTGGGKTIIFTEIARRATAKGSKTLILVHRQELLAQTVDKLLRRYISHGVIAASRRELVRAGALPECHSEEDPEAPVQVAMKDSLVRRQLPWDPTLIVIDEAHLAQAEGMKALLERWPRARRLLVSATPFRLDGKGFEDLASKLVETPDIGQMIDLGYLVPPETYTIPGVDLEGLKKRCGEFEQGQAAERFDKAELVGNLVETHKRLAGDRLTILFASSVKHSRHVVEQLGQAGIRAAHIDGETPKDERNRVLSDLRSGRIKVVSNFGVLCEGFDCPPVSCIQIARATASTCLWIQMSGRGLRTHPGKQDCLILDHGGNVGRHGLIDAERTYTLEGRRPDKDGCDVAAQSVSTCKVCYACFSSRLKVCPRCGADRVVKARPETKAAAGQLVRITKDMLEQRERERRRSLYTNLQPCPSWCDSRLWTKLDERRVAMGYKPGWTWGAAKSITERGRG